MRQRQPLTQQLRRFVWGRAVKRHQRGGHTRETANLGPPAIIDVRHLDLVRPSAYRVFELMDHHVEFVRN